MMKKYPKTVSSDSKGQLVIPKDARKELSIAEGTAFWTFVVENEGILLKRIAGDDLSSNDHLIFMLREKSSKISLEKANLSRTLENYRKKRPGFMEEL